MFFNFFSEGPTKIFQVHRSKIMASKKNRQDGSTRQLNDEESFFSLIERMYEDSGFELLDTNTPAVKEESELAL